MIVESVLPQNTTNIQTNGIPAVATRAVSNVPTFASTFRARALGSGSGEMDAIFDAAGREYNLSPDFIKAVAKVESNFSPHAVSPAGAMGVMQLMPGTAKYLGVDDPFDPEQNIFGGARYLREQLDRFDGDVKLALAAYNAGWPTVKQHGGIPPFRETQAYVPRVLGHLGVEDIANSAVTYNGFNMNGTPDGTSIGTATNDSFGAFNFNEAMAQMLFAKIIDMQMNSSEDNLGMVF